MATGRSAHPSTAVDRMDKDTTAQLGARIEGAEGRSQEYLHLIFIVRSLERVGDLASNIGEDAVYLEQAKDLRHLSKSDRVIPEED